MLFRSIRHALVTTTLLASMLLPATRARADETEAKPIAQRDRSPPMRTVAKVNIVVGGSLILGGVVTALAGLLKKKSVDDGCPGKICPPERAGDLSTLRGFENVTNALWISGAIVLGSGIGLYLYGEDVKTQASPANNGSLRIAPSPGGVSAVGTF